MTIQGRVSFRRRHMNLRAWLDAEYIVLSVHVVQAGYTGWLHTGVDQNKRTKEQPTGQSEAYIVKN